MPVTSPRGYFGVGIVGGKCPENVGGLWRSAHAFGAAMIFTIAFRSPRQATDTTKATRHVPLFTWPDWDAFMTCRPEDCDLVAVERANGSSRAVGALPAFRHPERALYILGAEDHGLSDAVLADCAATVEIPSSFCLNVATAGSIVMYDRRAKEPPARNVGVLPLMRRRVPAEQQIRAARAMPGVSESAGRA